MRNVPWIFLVLSFALLASAQEPQTCSAPPEYPNTRLQTRYATIQKFLSGEKVYYDCAEDFSPYRGNRAAQCDGGTWTQLTLKCEKKSCVNAGDLPNGVFEYEDNSFVGAKVYAKCKEGYTLKGFHYMICKQSGWTGEFPSCVEGEATCSTPTVANSVSSPGDVSVYQVGDSVTFTCSRGFQLDGAQQITCGSGGLWQPQPPRCVPSPDEETAGCGVPVTTRDSKANLADKYIVMTSFAHRDEVLYKCDLGYVPSGGSRFRRCVAGEWTPMLLKCERKSCGSAGEILNGQFTYTGVKFGDTATAVCNEGHRLVRQATRKCMNKGWDGRTPACKAVVCAEPQGVTTAEMKGPHEPPYAYRTVIPYHCRVGTLIGQSNIWCTKDGTWSDPPPKCKEITCPAPNVPDAAWMGAQSKLYQNRETISIECIPGYTLTGPSTITCGGDGQWSPGLPKCTQGEATCSTPAVANSVSSPGDVSVYQVGDYVTFTCSRGFQLDGAQQITCGSGGLWQPQPPRCVPSPGEERCGVPVTTRDSHANLADKYIVMTSFARGDEVLYKCDLGYVHSGGSRFRRCVAGQWTPMLLKCERKSCGSAGEILNGEFTYTGVKFGDTATAVCNEGHLHVGRATRNCMNKGWDGRVPTCEAVVCAEPQGVTTAEMKGPHEPPYTYRTVIPYHCRVGTLIGQRNIWCTKDGTWSDPPPKCKEITCAAPNVPDAYWMGAQSKLYQNRETISIECIPGYTLTGPSTVTCGGDGQWSPGLPKCTQNDYSWWRGY